MSPSHLIFGALFLFAIPIQVAATDRDRKARPSQAPTPSAQTCLSKIGFNKGHTGKRLAIAVPEDRAAKFVARGFTVVNCRALHFHNPGHSRVSCTSWRMGDPALQDIIWRRFSVTPREMCQEIIVAEVP